MKFRINRPVKLQYCFPEDLELMDSMTVFYDIVDDEVIVREQKCNLDEIAMNELFSEVLYNEQINYNEHGGAGCEFGISID